jgi:hypothetical protein
VLSVLFRPQFFLSFLIFSGQMEGFQPSSMEEVDNMTWDQLDIQSEEDAFNMSELLSYVILKHILSEDDCLQFSYSSVYPIIPWKQAGIGGSSQPRQ